MKILIIGVNGFIGSHLYKYLSINHECYGADITNNVYSLNNYVNIDIENPNFCKLFSLSNFDVCINASGTANVTKSMIEPVNDSYSNYFLVERILEAMVKTKQNCKFILMSSAAVYGNPEKLPVTENDRINPLSPYGYHKYFAEKTCEMYTKLFGIKTYSLRLFSVYGIGQKKLLLWDIYKKITFDSEVTLFGSGNESRDYIYITDVARCIELFATMDVEPGVYNVANGKQILIKNIAKLMKELLASNKPIIFTGNERKGDPLNWEADITKIETLGYTQSIKLEKGLKEYISWAKENCFL